MNSNELTDMVQVYFECRTNSCAAVRLYRERYPNREAPKPQKFARLINNLRLYGAFKKPKRTESQFRDQNVQLDVLLHIEENPKTSIREIARNVGKSKRTVNKILKNDNLKSYIPQKVHTLQENDPERRLGFCNWYLQKLRENRGFYRNIIWSDECTFTTNGIFNRNIHRQWSRENPRLIVETNAQIRFSLNVWCGIFRDRLIGPVFIDGSLNQDKYFEILSQHLQNFLDELPLADLNVLYFQQDGATPHNARRNVNYLNQQFGEKWLGTYGPVPWPARSADLTPLDFFFWGYIQDVVYLTSPENRDVLRQRIINACREVPPHMFVNATFGVARRCQLCVTHNGGHVEQYL